MENTVRTLYTSGCSYTHYNWPTWSDYLGVAFDDYYNVGCSAAGNRFIFNHIAWLITNNKIKPQDTVIIQWSALSREDRILTNNDRWTVAGNINYQDTYDDNFINKYFNVVQSSTELISYISTLELALKQIGCDFHMTCMFDYHIENFFGEPATPNNVLFQYRTLKQTNQLEVLRHFAETKFIRPCIEIFKWRYKDIMFMKYNDDMDCHQDDHPSPIAHYRYAVEAVLPLLKNVTEEGKAKLLDKKHEESARSWTNWYSDYEKVNNSEAYNRHEQNHPELEWPTVPKEFDTVNYGEYRFK